MKHWNFYAGVVDDKIHVMEVDDGWGGFGQGKIKVLAIFPSRKLARERYEQVERVAVKVVRQGQEDGMTSRREP